MRLLLVLAASAGLLPAAVAAETTPPSAASLADQGPPPAATAPPPRRTPIFTGLITPFSLPFEIFELTRPDLYPIVGTSIELRLHPRLGIGAMGLAGVHSKTYMDGESHATFYEVGLEPRFYVLGGFRGPTVGAALHYFRMRKVFTDLDGVLEEADDFAGYTYGPFMGYKYTARVGFTVEIKAGFEFIARTMTGPGSHPNITPMMDGKVGWSF
jgi:hypothetical protein